MIRKALLKIARWIYQHYGAIELKNGDTVDYYGKQYGIYYVTQRYNGAETKIEIIGNSEYRWR